MNFKSIDSDDYFFDGGNVDEPPRRTNYDRYSAHIKQFNLHNSKLVEGIEINRRHTDTGSIKIIVSFFTIWLGFVIFAFYTGNLDDFGKTKTGLGEDILAFEANSEGSLILIAACCAAVFLYILVISILACKAVTILLSIVVLSLLTYVGYFIVYLPMSMENFNAGLILDIVFFIPIFVMAVIYWCRYFYEFETCCLMI